MQVTVNQRLKFFAEEKKLTQYRLAKDIGVTPSAINLVFKDRNELRISTVEKILSAYPDLSVEWLVLGRGPMLIESGQSWGGNGAQHTQQTQPPEKEGDKGDLQGYCTIPYRIIPV